MSELLKQMMAERCAAMHDAIRGERVAVPSIGTMGSLALFNCPHCKSTISIRRVS